MKINIQTQYTIFENPSSEEICKNTPMVKVSLATELFQHLFGRIPEKHPGRFMKTANA